MAYEFRQLARSKVRYDDDNDDNPLVMQLVDDGKKLTPTAATVTIYAPGGTTALVSAASGSVSGTLVTYSVDTTTEASWPIDQGYRAEWTITSGGTGYLRVQMFDVARFVPTDLLIRDALVDYDDSLRGGEWRGDPTLQGVIASTRAELRMRLEARARQEGRLLDEMIIDHQTFGVAARPWVMRNYYRAKKDQESFELYNSEARETWAIFMNAIKWDLDQDGTESEDEGVPLSITLVT